MKVLTWQVREQKGMSLRELSEVTGLGKTTLNNIENQIISPTLEQLDQIATALNVEIEDLYDRYS